jgi:hypothetical protein
MERPPRKTWTSEEDAKLRDLWEQGHRAQKLADAFGRNERAVAERVALLGIRHPD